MTNTLNGKKYVGQTTHGLKRRYAIHLYMALNKNSDGLLHRAIRKYGQENFVAEVIATATCKESLDELEDIIISQLGSRIPDGYNIREKGSSGKHSLETRLKISQNRGTPVVTDESRRKMGDATRGKPRSEEVRKKISASRRGQLLSAETKAKIGKAGLGRAVSQATRDKIRASLTGHERYGHG